MRHHVDADAALPVAIGCVGTTGHDDPGVRAEQIDRTVTLLGRIDERDDVRFVGHVAEDSEPTDLPGDVLDAWLDIGHDDAAGPFRREPPRQRGADP